MRAAATRVHQSRPRAAPLEEAEEADADADADARTPMIDGLMNHGGWLWVRVE